MTVRCITCGVEQPPFEPCPTCHPSPAQLLERARVAWRAKVEAAGNVARLDGYRHLSPGMRADRYAWMAKQLEAERVLAQILGGPR